MLEAVGRLSVKWGHQESDGIISGTHNLFRSRYGLKTKSDRLYEGTKQYN
jgi:hypothetical protein